MLTNPTELETADRNFYRNGVISKLRQYQSPGSVRYGSGRNFVTWQCLIHSILIWVKIIYRLTNLNILEMVEEI